LPVLGSGPVLFGVELWIGWVALAGCAITTTSFFFRLKNAKLWRKLVLSGGLLTLVSTLTCIVFPDFMASSFEKLGYISYRVLFGAYVTLIGSILTSSIAILELYQARRTMSPNNPDANDTHRIQT
jgi:hypothetical protein